MGFWSYPRYVTVAEKKAKAAKKLKQLKKKMPHIKPVVLEGNTLARTWWGKTWNKNLERYADYENRIGRGRSYVRHGAVLDLQIEKGKVSALVQGSDSAPYEVVVSIEAMKKTHWKTIQKECAGQLKSLQALLAGNFPETLAEIFFHEKRGLFPGPKAISFSCSCPDWASMCKHVAAVLYGIGARFDEDPSLFFILRGVDTSDLIAKAVDNTTGELLAKTKSKSANVLDDADLSDMFGIDLEVEPDFSNRKPASDPVTTPQNQKRGEGKPSADRRKKRQPVTATGRVAGLISSSITGISISELVEETGYTKTKLYGIVHQLKKQGKIKALAHGVYGRVE